MGHLVLDILNPDNEEVVLVAETEEAGPTDEPRRERRDRQVQKQVININGEIVPA